jgi:multisubunit Na+/H+ antiporter MnhF subunit
VSPWLLGTIVLLAGGFPPSLWMASRGSPVDRMVGLELGGVVTTLSMLGFAQAVGQTSYLMVPLAAAVLSFAGALVFTRLLAPRE